MTRTDPPEGPALDPDPSKATRREALTASLRPGRHLDYPRSHSTLVERSEGDTEALECHYCASLIRAAVQHLTGHVLLDDYPAGYEALRRAIAALPPAPAEAPAGEPSCDDPDWCVAHGKGGSARDATEGSGDVVDDQGEGEPAPAARRESHEGAADE